MSPVRRDSICEELLFFHKLLTQHLLPLILLLPRVSLIQPRPLLLQSAKHLLRFLLCTLFFVWDVQCLVVFTAHFKVVGSDFELLWDLELSELIHDKGGGLKHSYLLGVGL